jgi:DNA-binding response OmpR family regulator
MPGDRALAEELGVRQYLVKPFTQAQFVEHVKLTLEGETS